MHTISQILSFFCISDDDFQIIFENLFLASCGSQGGIAACPDRSAEKIALKMPALVFRGLRPFSTGEPARQLFGKHPTPTAIARQSPTPEVGSAPL